MFTKKFHTWFFIRFICLFFFTSICSGPIVLAASNEQTGSITNNASNQIISSDNEIDNDINNDIDNEIISEEETINNSNTDDTSLKPETDLTLSNDSDDTNENINSTTTEKIYTPEFNTNSVKSPNLSTSLLVQKSSTLSSTTQVASEKTSNNTADSILELLNSGASSIHIPAGTYDFKDKKVSFKKNVTIYGDGADNTILKNIGFSVPYGITLKDLSINRGVNMPNTWTHEGGCSTYNVIIFGNHTSSNLNYEYENVNFSNTDFVSYVQTGPTLKSDSAKNCNFNNIKRIAIYHPVNSLSSTYTYNKFQSIGDPSVSKGVVSALFIGDVCNITYNESNNCVIDHNTFNDLYTADDPTLTQHAINANFIAVRARKAFITNNNVSNVHGYGKDREAIYSKVMFLTVSNNTIKNGGFGEGYITCKGQDGANAFSTVTNNTIIGEYGSGIYTYGAAQIKGNNIEISKCSAAVVSHIRDYSTTNKLSINNNIINCKLGFHELEPKNANQINKAIVLVNGKQCAVSIQANNITLPDTGITIGSVIKVTNAAHDVNISSNTISSTIKNCLGIAINANEDSFDTNKNSIVTVNGNNITATDLAIQIIYNNPFNKISNRTFNIFKNKLNGSKTTKYGIYLSSGTNNNDTLNYSSPYANNYLSNILYTDSKKIASSASTLSVKK